MPYRIRHLRKTKKNCYQVINPKKKRVFSKCTTKKNAQKQIRLLRALQYSKTFKLRPANNSGREAVGVRGFSGEDPSDLPRENRPSA